MGRKKVIGADHLAKKCADSLRAVVAPGIGFGAIKSGGNRLAYLLHGLGEARGQAKFFYPVVPLYATPDWTFWVAVALEFVVLKGVAGVDQASVLIFEGSDGDNVKAPLLRAEWDVARDTASSHAQPHWHVYQVLSTARSGAAEFSGTAGVDPQEFGLEEVESEGQPAPAIERLEEFHFAMSASWQTGAREAHRTRLSPEELPGWLFGCVSYVKGQLAYLYGR